MLWQWFSSIYNNTDLASRGFTCRQIILNLSPDLENSSLCFFDCIADNAILLAGDWTATKYDNVLRVGYSMENSRLSDLTCNLINTGRSCSNPPLLQFSCIFAFSRIETKRSSADISWTLLGHSSIRNRWHKSCRDAFCAIRVPYRVWGSSDNIRNLFHKMLLTWSSKAIWETIWEVCDNLT